MLKNKKKLKTRSIKKPTVKYKTVTDINSYLIWNAFCSVFTKTTPEDDRTKTK